MIGVVAPKEGSKKASTQANPDRDGKQKQNKEGSIQSSLAGGEHESNHGMRMNECGQRGRRRRRRRAQPSRCERGHVIVRDPPRSSPHHTMPTRLTRPRQHCRVGAKGMRGAVGARRIPIPCEASDSTQDAAAGMTGSKQRSLPASGAGRCRSLLHLLPYSSTAASSPSSSSPPSSCSASLSS